MELVALVLRLAAGAPLAVLPRPRLDAPASEPAQGRLHFVVESSRTQPVTVPNEPAPPAETSEGAPLQRVRLEG